MDDRERIDRLERELSFLARFVYLAGMGHATLDEHERARKIRDRYDRFTDAPTREP